MEETIELSNKTWIVSSKKEKKKKIKASPQSMHAMCVTSIM